MSKHGPGLLDDFYVSHYNHKLLLQRKSPWKYNILNRIAGGRAPARFENPAKGVVIYEYIWGIESHHQRRAADRGHSEFYT